MFSQSAASTRAARPAVLRLLCATFMEIIILVFRFAPTLRCLRRPRTPLLAFSFDRIGAHTCTNHTVPYGTALLGWRCPGHFVPGYGRTVPPGHLPFLRQSACQERG